MALGIKSITRICTTVSDKIANAAGWYVLYICSSYQWREGGWTRGHWYQWARREAKIEGIDISGEGRIGRKAQDACAEYDRARIRFLLLSPYWSFWLHSADAVELWKSPRSFDIFPNRSLLHDKTTIYGAKVTSALKSRQNETKGNESPANLPAIYIFLPRVRTRTANSVRVYVGRVNETPTKSYISRINLRRTPLSNRATVYYPDPAGRVALAYPWVYAAKRMTCSKPR